MTSAGAGGERMHILCRELSVTFGCEGVVAGKGGR